MNASARLLDGVWLVLLAGTAYTWWLGESGQAGALAVMTMLGVAALKGLLVIREFMALRDVSWLWQGAVSGWLILVLTVNLAVYWKGL